MLVLKYNTFERILSTLTIENDKIRSQLKNKQFFLVKKWLSLAKARWKCFICSGNLYLHKIIYTYHDKLGHCGVNKN